MDAQQRILILQNEVAELKHKLSSNSPEILDDKPYEVKDEVAKAYSKKHGFSLEEAKKRLEANYKAEYESVDGREMALGNTKYLRQIGPKVNGLEMREQAVHRKLESLEKKVQALDSLFTEVKEIKDDYNLVKSKLLDSLQGMVDYHDQMVQRDNDMGDKLKKLEELSSETFLVKVKRFFSKLLCRLKLK